MTTTSTTFDLVSKYINTFSWSSNPPASSIYIPLVTVAVYLVVIYSIAWYVRTVRKGRAFECNTLFGYHNLLMSFLSLVMFVGCAIEVFRRMQREGSAKWFICESPSHTATGAVYFWSYMYYLSKYYELLDTVFLALKGKLVGWGGLNVYHHSIVVFMAWWWLEYAQSIQFYGLLFNTSVHVIMYYYFYLRSMGKTPKWRNYITLYQIIQFVSSNSLILPETYLHFTTDVGCSGHYAIIVNLVFNVTLLSEFMGIFRTSMKNKKETTKKVE